jgi:hypothetical protein
MPCGQRQVPRDERLRFVHPAAEVALCRIDVREHITDQHAVLVLDHGWPRDHLDVRQLSQRHGGARRAILLEQIDRS